MRYLFIFLQFSLFKVLIDHKSNVNPIMRNNKGQLLTPLDAALFKGNRGCAKYIQLHGGVPATKLTDKHALQKALSKYVFHRNLLSPEYDLNQGYLSVIILPSAGHIFFGVQ